jgi:hypothetical protein
MVFGNKYVFAPRDLHKAQLINEEIARISRVVTHPKFRGIGLGAHLVRETLPKVGAKVVEVLAVMAKYNPFFEDACMLRVDYRRDETSVEGRIRKLLESRGFDFTRGKSKAYCNGFFNGLADRDRKTLIEGLSDFAHQPFVKMETVTPDLLTKVFSSDGVYLYWVNCSRS